ncbi:hypothetical protein IAQ61_005007 [Plenodomus lingam]|uniref:uncharacterized protein n=1 Tax=Leptosphaeria maculans TaxID=5022 RepID=UPI0033324562|nr:hypothetical protein IAQ61_005007 [Plenodomus lingam]
MRWLLPFAAVLWLPSFGVAVDAAESNLTYSGAPRLSLTGVTPTLEITEGYILAQTNTSVTAFADRATCSAANPCVDGLCGYRPEHCRPNSPATCLSNCDATAPCGQFSTDGSTSCPLNLCCSYFGFCGASEPFCHDQVQEQTGLDAPCQGNCAHTQTPSCGENSASTFRKIAYYEAWNLRLRDCDKVMPNQLDTRGLTHLVLAFASIDPKSYGILPMNPDDESIYSQFLALPGTFKKIIGVGGWEFSDPGSTRHTWSDMTSSQEHRKAFISSLKQFISKWHFTGIDIDWEWPGSSDRGGNSADKENQIALVTELRKAMGADFSISVVIPAQYDYLKNMDPAGLDAHVDWLNILAYDLHGPWDANVNGLGPYIKPHTDLKEIDAALELLWSAKVTPKNVVLGLANYGRGYVVENKNCMWYGCKFTGPSRAGECTKQDGVLSTCEIRRIISRHGLEPKIIGGSAGVKEITWDDHWVGYDDAETFDLKLKLANNRCLGGTALWAIDYATCGGDGGPPQPGSSVAPAPTESKVSTKLPSSSQTSVLGPRPPSQSSPQQSSSTSSVAPSIPGTTSNGVPLPPVQSSRSTVGSLGASNAPWSSAMSSSVPSSSNSGSSAQVTATQPGTASETLPGITTSAHLSSPSESSSTAWAPSVSDSQKTSATISGAPSSGSLATSPTSATAPSGVPIIVPTASFWSSAPSSSHQAGSSDTTTATSGSFQGTSVIVVPTASQSNGESSVTISTGSTSRSPQSGTTSDAPSLSATSAVSVTSGASSSAFSTAVPSSTGGIVVVPIPSPSSVVIPSSGSNVATWSTTSTVASGHLTSSSVGFIPSQSELTTVPASGTSKGGTSSLAQGTSTGVASSNGPVSSSIAQGSSTSTSAISMTTSGTESSQWQVTSATASGGASVSEDTSTAAVTSGTTTTYQNTETVSGTPQGSSTPGTTSQGSLTTGTTPQGTSKGSTSATSSQSMSTTAATSQATSNAGTSPAASSQGASTTAGTATSAGATTGGSHPTLVPGVEWDSDSHSDSDPDCKPNDCVQDCINWRAITFLIIKRPICPCVPHTCDKKSDNKKKKCKLFGCGCGWMGLSFGPGCSGIEVDITGILPPGGLFGENPCRFFGCPGSTPGLIGNNGYCYGPGCDPCPPEICSGHGPSPGPNPTQPSGRPKECEEKEKTRVTERFVYCTENFNVSVSVIPSSILGTASTMISTACVPMIEATLKACPGALEGYTTTTTTTLANTMTSSSGAPACTRAPLNLDEDEGSNEDPLSSSITYRSNTTRIGSSTNFMSSTLNPSSSSILPSSSSILSSSSSILSSSSSILSSSSSILSSSSSVKSSSSSVKPSSSLVKPSSTSKKPDPMPSSSPFDPNGKWKAKITVTMEYKVAQLAWVLFDPKGEHAGEQALFIEGSQLSMRIESKNRKNGERSAPYAVTMIGTDLTNVQKARVAFTIEKPMKGCNYANGNPCTPTMTTENWPETKMFEVDSCEFYCTDKKDVKMYQSDLWCDDLNDAMWLPKNAGFERVFWCGWKGY